jgi:hypothetical protein
LACAVNITMELRWQDNCDAPRLRAFQAQPNGECR